MIEMMVFHRLITVKRDNMIKLPRREFLMLAKTYNPDRHTIGGYYLSEKLDGTRVFWDGGLSRGLPTMNIPWANIVNPKTNQLKKKIKPIATGLWSRYANPIIAPDWFLNQLPCMPLDGEIHAGRGNFQLARSICAGDTPGEDWDKAEYAIFSTPAIDKIFSDGEIKNTNMKMKFRWQTFNKWLQKRSSNIEDWYYITSEKKPVTFDIELSILRDTISSEGVIYLHNQKRLPFNVKEAAAVAEIELHKIIMLGGEGIILRDSNSCWEPKRSPSLLKWKPYNDAEGVVVGFTSGRQTDKGSKHLGRIGALILDYGGKRLELSGMTDVERVFADSKMIDFAKINPGVDMPSWFQGTHFKVGNLVTFKYRELSNDGIPKEARYFRHRR